LAVSWDRRVFLATTGSGNAVRKEGCSLSTSINNREEIAMRGRGLLVVFAFFTAVLFATLTTAAAETALTNTTP
jgi:hypothetical protein